MHRLVRPYIHICTSVQHNNIQRIDLQIPSYRITNYTRRSPFFATSYLPPTPHRPPHPPHHPQSDYILRLLLLLLLLLLSTSSFIQFLSTCSFSSITFIVGLEMEVEVGTVDARLATVHRPTTTWSTEAIINSQVQQSKSRWTTGQSLALKRIQLH